MKSKNHKSNPLMPFIICASLAMIYECVFMSPNIDLDRLSFENPVLYKILITYPLLFLLCFFIIWAVTYHIIETIKAWRKEPEIMKDELKLFSIGILFFIFLTVVYIIIKG